MKMHLSTRWGVPYSQIDNLPAEEISRQMSFYEEHPWGNEGNLLAWSLACKIPKTKPKDWLLAAQSIRIKQKKIDTSIEKAREMTKQLVMMAKTLGAKEVQGGGQADNSSSGHGVPDARSGV